MGAWAHGVSCDIVVIVGHVAVRLWIMRKAHEAHGAHGTGKSSAGNRSTKASVLYCIG